METPNNFTSLINWLTGAGGALILVAWATSWGLEGWAKWAQLDSRLKSLIILVASLVIGLAAVWASTWSSDFVGKIEPYVKATLAIIAAWLATQTAHRLNPLRKI